MPFTIPYLSIASYIYCEQVGVNLQDFSAEGLMIFTKAFLYGAAL